MHRKRASSHAQAQRKSSYQLLLDILRVPAKIFINWSRGVLRVDGTGLIAVLTVFIFFVAAVLPQVLQALHPVR